MLHETAAFKDKRNIRSFGMAALVRHLYEGKDITPISNALLLRADSNPNDAAAFLDLSTILFTLGQKEKAKLAQEAALAASRIFEVRHGRANGPRVLTFVTAGDFMANTPIDFLLERSDATILFYYVDAGTESLHDVPAHDVAFVAVGESQANRPVLENLERLLANWQGPILNSAPRGILNLTRDGVAQLFADEPTIVAPATCRAARSDLEKLAAGQVEIAALLSGATFPIIARPLGTHAGHGMAQIASRAELAAYLGTRAESDFYVAPFVDYAGPDGRYRKERIAFINGRPFASHMAISDHWMVHYLSAGMAESEERRAEEAEWMATFESRFAARHARAFDELYRRIGLDYFAVDCAEMPDGRLLLFEVDVAMIVHAMDSDTTFPYKKRAMDKLFEAFGQALERRATANLADLRNPATVAAGGT